MACLPETRSGFVRGLASASLWIACATLAPLGASAAPPPVTAPDPAPAPAAPAAVSDVNATSPRAELDDRAALESFFDGVFDVGMKEHHVAGAAVAVVKDGQLLFTKGYGYQDIDRAIPVDPHKTLFRIGSTTKLFTWTSVMQLVEQGKLDLDKDVNTYLRDVHVPATYDKPITLRDIMTHTSGFEEGFLGYLITDDPQKQIPIKEAMQRHMPARVRPPGVMSAYSNYATALAGLIVEQVSGEPYNDYIARHIFEPLDMQFAAVQEPVPQRLGPYVATSYKQKNGAPVAQKYEIVGGFRPAGSGAVSAVDMTHFMIAHLQDGRYGSSQILKPETAQLMHRTAFQLDPRFPGMALGFYHSNHNGLDAIGHGGDVAYCHTDLLLIPARQIGLFVSFYTTDNRVRERVVDAFFDRYFPAPPEAKTDAKIDATTVIGPEVVAAAQRYTGSYEFTRRNHSKLDKLLSFTTQMSVSALPDGNLVVSGALGPEPWQFRPVGENLYLQIGGKTHLAFRSDAQGHPTHMFLDFLPFMPMERTPWYERTGFWYVALGLAFLTFVAAVIRAGFRRREIKALPVAPRRAERLALATAAWALATVAVFGAVLSVHGEGLSSGIPTSFKLALTMPVIFVVLAAVLVIATFRAWRDRRSIFLSLVALAAVVFSLWLWQWNVLGWQFG
jgi:CubicO group peptidase (beta-lactamase class C family)